MRIAILTRDDNRSPRILAESLLSQLQKHHTEAKIFYTADFLTRMVSWKESRLSFHFCLRERLRYLLRDIAAFNELRGFDAVIFSECAPYAFLKRMYAVEKLKRKLKKPIGFYEVYYLGNAPTQIEFLKNGNNPLLERFDFHLSVSAVTEIKHPPTDNWFSIGIEGKSWGLSPLPKKEMIAILDFVQPANEVHREAQIRSLKKVGIKYVSLEKEYTVEEIRNIYQQGSIYLMQSSEAFGLPVLECFCCGCQVFTPHSWWPMSWRLEENPRVHEGGKLPSCFTVYDNEEGLVKKLMAFKETYDPDESPKSVFKTFVECYPEFYFGNESEVKAALQTIQSKIDAQG